MSFPSNIAKDHLLKAIERIDREGIPTDADSQYYDVVSNGKRYPPKVVVSYANVLANGVELDRKTFSGGINTPCFKLLEANGFVIEEKMKDYRMAKVKIYEVKSGSAENAGKLLSPDGKFFYWNNSKFLGNELGDYVYFVNRYANWALFTKLGAKDIITRQDRASKTSSFNHEYNTYTVADPDGVYNLFMRFDILQRVNIPHGWNWNKQLGQAETYDLRKEGREGDLERLEKIDDLEKLFTAGAAQEVLQECRTFLQSGTEGALLKEIVAAIQSPQIQEIVTTHDFLFQLSQDKLQELIRFKSSTGNQLYEDLMTRYKQSGGFEVFLQSLSAGSEEQRLMTLIGELIAYCDVNAANKNQFNLYPDKRVLAKSSIRQPIWVDNLLHYKLANHDVNVISSPGIKNAIAYLLDPRNASPILSENHRELVSYYLLRTRDYNKETFPAQLISFFEPYHINPANVLNLTRIINVILYLPDIKSIWLEDVEGLVVCDNTGWIEEAISDLKDAKYIVLWWDKKPTGGQNVLKLLKDKIQSDGHFYIYYTVNQSANYRSKIVDFATAEDYVGKNWNINDDVAWYQNDFDGYSTTSKKARIAFLAEEVIKLAFPLPVSKFDFYKDYSAPTQNNMQPYAQLNEDIEVANIPEAKTKELSLLPVGSDFDFKYEYRVVLKAIQTKPFILLAGLSGTGKSRLVRTLAYKTCAIKELQGDKPGNFQLVMVRPNWHDSSELMGYLTRIDGTKYTPTDFLKFLVKAWKFPQIPFFLCLDEMNLAPVEQYFAEFLSLIETRDVRNQKVVTDSLLTLEKCESEKVYAQLLKDLDVQQSSTLWSQFMEQGISLPPNLVVMGTVNMDETTHSFSRKVLDRAMTFEMNEVDLMSGLEETNHHWSYEERTIAPSFVLGEHTAGGQVYHKFKEADSIVMYLEEINYDLDRTPFKIAYRVRDEFLIYCYHNSLLSDKPATWLHTCLDEMTHMKILSRIEGDASKAGSVIDKLLNRLPSTYSKSRNKLEEMKKRLIDFGYTSYWS
jgi:hypothetical protein